MAGNPKVNASILALKFSNYLLSFKTDTIGPCVAMEQTSLTVCRNPHPNPSPSRPGS